MIDTTQPFRLTVKSPVLDDNGDHYAPGDYRPGELPTKFMQPHLGHNIGADTPVPIVEPLDVRPPSRVPTTKLAIDYDRIDINTAKIDDIITVDGIGTPTASKIVKERDNGNYADVANLVTRIPSLAKLTTILEERFSFEND